MLLKKEMELGRSNNWSPELEDMVKSVGDTCIGYKWMHNRAAVFFIRQQRIVKILAGLLSIINSATITIDTTYVRTSSPDTIWLSILSIIFATSILALLGFLEWNHLDELSHTHQTYATRYTGLVSNIRRELAMESTHRQNAHDYIAWMSQTADGLFELAPKVRPSIKIQYKKHAIKVGLPIPDEDVMSVTVLKIDKQAIIESYKDTSPVRNQQEKTSQQTEIQSTGQSCTNSSLESIQMGDLSPATILYIDQILEDPPEQSRFKTKRYSANNLIQPPFELGEIIDGHQRYNERAMQYELSRWK